MNSNYRWRFPEEGDIGFNANLTELGVGEGGRLYRRFMFDETVSVTSDQHLEIDPDGAHWLCGPEGRIRQLKGSWARIDEPVE